jgi:uncharacterized membrane-anchored protein
MLSSQWRNKYDLKRRRKALVKKWAIMPQKGSSGLSKGDDERKKDFETLMTWLRQGEPELKKKRKECKQTSKKRGHHSVPPPGAF